MLLASVTLIILIGIVLLILEILVLPGLIAGIIGSIMIICGIWLMYFNFGNIYGHISLIASLCLFVLSLWFSFKYDAWKRLSLQQASEGKIQRTDELNLAVGDTGITISAVRPMGTALFNNTRVEVMTQNEMINSNTKIRIIEILPNKLIVEKAE